MPRSGRRLEPDHRGGAAGHPGRGFAGIALDPDGPLDAYRREHHLAFPIVTFPAEKLRRLYRARSVPLVVLLDSTGRVLYSRLGALEDEAAIDSVLDALKAPDPMRTDLSADVAARDGTDP